MMSFDSIPKMGRETVDVAMRSSSAVWAGMQGAATEAADYAKRAIEAGQETAGKLMGVRSVDAAVQVQGEFAKSAYEGFVAHATRMGELATQTAKDAFAPIEGLMANPTRNV